MHKVEPDRNTFNKCLCGACPVQRKSQCVIGKEKQLEPLKEDIEKFGKMPEPATIIPGIYCSAEIGKSECGDLSPEKVCLCPACAVSLQSNLASNYYCAHGSADRIG